MKIHYVALAAVMMLTFSGCTLFDLFTDPLSFGADIPEDTTETEETAAEATDEAAVNADEEEIEAEEETTTEEEEKDDDNTIADVFEGTWWLYQEFPNWKSVSKMSVQQIEGKDDYVVGTMQALESTVTYEDGTTDELGINPKVIGFEIVDGKMEFTSEKVDYTGAVTPSKKQSTGSGTMSISGSWYMTNVQLDEWPSF